MIPPPALETLRGLVGRIQPRIYGLVNRGAEICSDYQPRPPLDSVPGCDRCGYLSDVHLLRDVVVQLESALSALDAQPTRTCAWIEDEDGKWDSACGEAYCFTVDGPAENGVRFCHGCGAPVVPKPYVEPPEDA